MFKNGLAHEVYTETLLRSLLFSMYFLHYNSCACVLCGIVLIVYMYFYYGFLLVCINHPPCSHHVIATLFNKLSPGK